MRHKALKVVAGVFTLLVAGVAAVWWLSPPTVVRTLLAIERSRRGLEAGALTLGGDLLPFYRREGPAPILMIHGYADSKESWMEFSSVVGTAHGVVIPDLAGYGASVMAENGDIGVEAQVERVAAIIAALKLAPVHLAGVSMGGEIAGLVAARHPDKVKTLALFNTAGGASDTNTALVAQIDRGENPFDVQSVEDLRRLIGTMRTMPVSLPGPVERSVVSQFVSHRELWRNALADLKSVPVRSLLDSLAPTITAPTLIVWGEDDALFHPSIGRRLHARIAGSQFVLVPKCGHACVFEKPDSLGAQYVAFLKGR